MAAQLPEHTATVFAATVGSRVMNKAMRCQQLDDTISRFAAAMQKLGVKIGDQVDTLLPNCPKLVIAFCGLIRAGGTAVLSSFLLSADEMDHQLNDVAAEIIVILSLCTRDSRVFGRIPGCDTCS